MGSLLSEEGHRVSAEGGIPERATEKGDEGEGRKQGEGARVRREGEDGVCGEGIVDGRRRRNGRSSGRFLEYGCRCSGGRSWNATRECETEGTGEQRRFGEAERNIGRDEVGEGVEGAGNDGMGGRRERGAEERMGEGCEWCVGCLPGDLRCAEGWWVCC